MAKSTLTKTAATREGRAACGGPRKGGRRNADPLACLIRAQCRWRAQHGEAACAICNRVVTREIAPAAGLMAHRVV